MVKLKNVMKCLKLLGFDTNKIRMGGIKYFKYESVFKRTPYASDEKYYSSKQQVIIYDLDTYSFDDSTLSLILNKTNDGFGTAFYYADDAANNNVLGLINFNNGCIYILSQSQIKRLNNELKTIKQEQVDDEWILSITVDIDEFIRLYKKEKKNG